MRVTIILLTLVTMGCATARYNPYNSQTVQFQFLNRPPTQHELRTYDLYKDNPKKLNRWLKELKERQK